MASEDAAALELRNQLSVALNEGARIEQMLEQFELYRDKKVLAEATTNMKKITATLRELSSNPLCKTKENAPLFQQLSTMMKNLVQKTKNLASTSTSTTDLNAASNNSQQNNPSPTNSLSSSYNSSSMASLESRQGLTSSGSASESNFASTSRLVWITHSI